MFSSFYFYSSQEENIIRLLFFLDEKHNNNKTPYNVFWKKKNPKASEIVISEPIEQDVSGQVKVLVFHFQGFF